MTSSRSTHEAQLPARLPCQISPLLAWFGWLLAIKKRGLVGFWLASGWLLASFLVGHPPAWKNLVLTWLKLAGPPRCLGAALWRHCPSHKRSKVDGTIPRMGLRSSPGVDRLGRPVEALPLPQTKQSRWHNSTHGRAKQPKGCTSLISARLPAKSALCLPGWTAPCLEKSRTYLAETGVAGPPRCLGAALWRHWRNSTHGLAKQPRSGASRLGRPEKGCTSLTPCKAALPHQPSACLVGLPPAWKNLVLTWQKLVWLDLPAAWGRPCGGTATKAQLQMQQTVTWRHRSESRLHISCLTARPTPYLSHQLALTRHETEVSE